MRISRDVISSWGIEAGWLLSCCLLDSSRPRQDRATHLKLQTRLSALTHAWVIMEPYTQGCNQCGLRLFKLAASGVHVSSRAAERLRNRHTTDVSHDPAYSVAAAL